MAQGIYKQNQFKKPCNKPLQRWHIFLLLILSIGIFFRFFHLEQKHYWVDETITSLRVSGYTHPEIIKEVYNGRLIKAEDLQQYQYPNSKKSFVYTIKGLITEDAHPPLYFLTVRFWIQLFGNSIAVTRSFSAFLSLLAFPCLYWLCLELFESSFVAGIAVALFAISPFYVMYAQEARMYSLWTVQILLSNAILLRAMRLNTKTNWLLYSFTLALGFYSYLFSTLVAAGNGVYVLIQERFRLTRKIKYYVLSLFLSILLFLPWILVLLDNHETTTKVMSWQGKVSVNVILTTLVNNISHSFIDFWLAYSYVPNLSIPNLRLGLFIKPFLLALILYSLYFLCRCTQQKVWLFVLSLIVSTPFLIITKDLLTESGSSTQARYLVPCFLGLLLSIAYLLASKLSSSITHSLQRRFWKMVTILIIFGGILSCTISSQAETWSNKYGTNLDVIAHVINQATHPLVISDRSPLLLLSLSHQLHPEVQLQLLKPSSVPQIPTNFNEIFLLEPSPNLRQKIERNQQYQMVAVKKVKKLWLLKKQNS
jgi:uncharacterized membrane protein